MDETGRSKVHEGGAHRGGVGAKSDAKKFPDHLKKIPTLKFRDPGTFSAVKKPAPSIRVKPK